MVWKKNPFVILSSNLDWTMATGEFLCPQSHILATTKLFVGTTDMNAAPCINSNVLSSEWHLIRGNLLVNTLVAY